MFVHYIAWTPPYEDSCKLNFVGCVVARLIMKGTDYVFRNENAIFKVEAFLVDYSTFSTTIEVELEAMKFGLNEAIVQEVDYLEIEGDFAQGDVVGPRTYKDHIRNRLCSLAITSFNNKVSSCK
ncbi:hypothetical protein LguiB_003916 [Lonicera macranthoides]